MSKEPTQKAEQHSKALAKRMTETELREFLVKAAESIYNPFKKLSETYKPDELKGKDKEIYDKNVLEAIGAIGLDTHERLEASVNEEYRPLVREMSRQIIRDYDCKTAAEKALSEVAVNAYARVLESSWVMSNIRHNLKNITKEKNHFYSVLSKELDRANRQFINAITTLKQMKNPTLEVNVTAKTAFVAQNQQINADVASQPLHKTNESK